MRQSLVLYLFPRSNLQQNDISCTKHTSEIIALLLIDNATVQYLIGGVKRWWAACYSSKLSADPDGQVNLDHMEENKRDVVAILV
jgi:hypothetical protein